MFFQTLEVFFKDILRIASQIEDLAVLEELAGWLKFYPKEKYGKEIYIFAKDVLRPMAIKYVDSDQRAR